MTEKRLQFETLNETILMIKSAVPLSLELGNDSWRDEFKFHTLHLYAKKNFFHNSPSASSMNFQMDLILKDINKQNMNSCIQYQTWIHRLQSHITSANYSGQEYKVGHCQMIFGREFRLEGVYVYVKSVEFDETQLTASLHLDYYRSTPLKEEEHDLVHI